MIRALSIFVLALCFQTALSQTEAVPTVKADMVVNSMGALVYNVPIDVLKGVNSHQPNLALEYNSQSGNGMAGWGWNLSGLSMITRGGRSKEIDGATMGVQYDGNDPYYLDGQRLLQNGDDEFVTEKYSKIQISRVSGDDYTFIIKYTDGKIAKYDELASGQHYIVSLEDALGHIVNYNYTASSNNIYISSISYGGTESTPHKFFVNFIYANRATPSRFYRNGVLYVNNKILKEIKVSSGYITANQGLYKRYLLTFDLINNGSTERVKRLEVFNGQGDKLKPLDFSYNPASTIDVSSTTGTGFRNGSSIKGLGSVVTGDWNGNGKPMPAYEGRRQDDTYSLFTPYGSIYETYGNSKKLFAGKMLRNMKVTDNDILAAMNIDYLDNLTDRLTFKFIDIGYNPLHLKTVTIDLQGVMANNTPVGPFYMDPQGNITSSQHSRDKTNRTVLSGDFNNDALMDVVIIQKGGNNTGDKVYFAEIGKAANGFTIATELTGAFNFPFPKNIYQFEFNGDGIPDLLFVSGTTMRTYKINLWNNTYSAVTPVQTLNNYSDKTPLIFGDFNGDGLTDFMTPKNVYSIENSNIPTEYSKMTTQQQLWWEYIATGTSFTATQLDLTSKGLAYIAPSQRNYFDRSSDWEKFWSGKPDEYEYTEYGTSSIFAADINNDGVSDLVSMRKFGTAKYATNIWHTLVQNYTLPGADVMRFYITKTTASGARDFQQIPQTIALNELISPMSLLLNSSNYITLNKLKTEIVIHDALLRRNVYVQINTNNFAEGRLAEIDNGSAVKQKIQYSPMIAENYSGEDSREAYSTFATNLTYPYYVHRIIGNHYLTAKIHTIYNDKIITTEYRYQNAIQHLGGRGFTGFQKIYISDPYESIFTYSNYTVKNFFKGLFWKVSTFDPTLDNSLIETTYGSLDPGSVFSRTTNTWQRFNMGGLRYLMLTTTERSADYLKDITTTKTFQYDTSNGILLKEAGTNYNNTGVKIEKFTYKPEFNNGLHYFYGKIAAIESTSIKDGVIFKTEVRNYYNTNGSLLKKEDFGNNTPAITTEYTYHPFGEVETANIFTQGIEPQMTTYDYDPTNRFVWRRIGTDGLVNETNFDPAGKLISEISPLGLTTSYLYDNWGNIKQTTDYLGKKTFINRITAEGPGNYSVSKLSEGGEETVVTYDAFDRETLLKTKMLNNQWVFASTEYDIYGKVTRKSEPYLAGDPVKWNTTVYDDLNRPVEYTSFVGRVTKTCYEGLKVTVEDGHRKISKWVDAMGYVVKHQDGGGTMYYKYYPNGSLKEVDYDGIKTKVEIDGWGNRKKLTDPSAGNYLYEYDNLSRIKKETNPKGGITIYSYDAVGKLTSEVTTSASESTNISRIYSYDPVTQLPTVVSGNYNGKPYSYTTLYDDPYFRITEKKEVTGEAIYKTAMTYDEFGRLSGTEQTTTLLNPSFSTSAKIKNHYDSHGILYKQTDEDTGQLIYQTQNVNAAGDVTRGLYGNGYTLETNYSASNNLLESIHHYKSTTSALRVNYSYDVLKGLLLERNNIVFGKNERFEYDELDRLLTERLNNAVVQQYTYDQRGRMTSNTAVGKYNYNDQDYRLQNVNFNTSGTTLNSSRGFAEINYNAFKSPIDIFLPGKDRISYDYSILKTRSVSYYGSLAPEAADRPNRKYYSSDSSVEIVKEGAITKVITYIAGDPYTALYMKVDILNNGTPLSNDKYFLHRDHQGSILAITRANAAATIVEQRFFDAWGNLKAGIVNNSPVTPNAMGWVNSFLIDRGYTGHEHLKTVGLIHMNGRIYDPSLRRFMSPDNYVQDLEDTQKFNRFGYVWNNPLSYTDANGELAFLAAVGIGVAVAIIVNGISNSINDIPFWYGAGRAGTIGGITAAISFGIGSVATSAFTSTTNQALFQAGMHGLMGGVMNALNDGSFISGFASGMVSSLVSSGVENLGVTKGTVNSFGESAAFKATMIAAGGLSGGLSSAIAGGDFWVGVRQGIITSGLNHLAHAGANAYTRHKFELEIEKAFQKEGPDGQIRNFSTEKLLDAIKRVPTLNKWYNRFMKAFPHLKIVYKDFWHRSDYAQTHYNEAGTTVTDVTFYNNALESYRALSHVILHEFGHLNSARHGFIFDNVRKYGAGTETPGWIDEIYAHKFANHHGGSIINRQQYIDAKDRLMGRQQPIQAEQIKLPSFD